MSTNINNIYNDSVSLLKELISIPSISKEESMTARCIYSWLLNKGTLPEYAGNNVWCKNKYFDNSKQNLLLLSHHDTVRAAKSYTRDPFTPEVVEGKLFGLGSNDAGGPLVTLMGLFVYLYNHENLPFNLILCAAAEEEISGKNGLELALKSLPEIDFAIVGEPTGMNAAVSEKGLMVCDCISHGVTGHAAREEGINAITIAMQDIDWVNSFKFPQESPDLGPVKMTVAMIQGGVKHNVIPERCEFVIDVRTTDAYSNNEVLEIMQQNMQSDVKARSTRLQPSNVSLSNPFIQALHKENIKTFGSSTMSDQALLSCPSVKFSPGESARSHTADEYIYLSEIENGLNFFIPFFDKIVSKSDFNLTSQG
jgi:acetylornithine deacetylase